MTAAWGEVGLTGEIRNAAHAERRLEELTQRIAERVEQMAAEIDHPAMRRFIGRLRFFEYGILNHCAYPIGTSALEGANNKIKVIKRMAYGFRDDDYFFLKIRAAFPGNPG